MTAYTFSQLFDFTRTTAGTFVGSNGLIQNTPASVNLLLYTQDFDIATWNKAGGSVTVTANSATAPDGTSTADTVTESVGGTTHNIYQTATVVSGSAYTWSGYVKANGRSIVQFVCQATTTIYTVEFDLTAVTTTNRSGSGSATITAVGNGWYRVTATATSTGAGTGYWQLNLCSAANTPSYSGNGTSGIFLWGAQLEINSTATTYTRNNGGLFPARFEYDPVTLQPRGLLVEEQRTNLLLQSQNFDVSWGKTAVTVTVDTTVAPDGTTTADTLTASTNTAYVSQPVVFTADGDKTFSVFLKAGTSTSTRLTLRDTTVPANRATIEITWTGGVPSGVAAAGTLQGIDSFGNGWYRVRGLATGVIAANGNQFRFSPDVAVGTNNVIMWGAQAENGTFATSYIPTVASQVTRSPDICNIVSPMFAPWYNQSAGTFVADADAINFGVVRRNIQVDDGTGNERMYLGTNTSTNPYAVVVDGGVTQADMSATGTVSANTPYKITLAYAANNFALCGNGGAVTTDAAGTLPSPTLLRIGSSESSVFLNGHIRRVTYYPFRASNNQLQALTT
jgi:hypothetical protein